METPVVFVVDVDGRPLLPTHPARARQMLRDGKAEVLQMVPFTLRLKRRIEAPVGAFTVGLDDGAKDAGLAVVDDTARVVVLAGVVELRQDVPGKMTSRKSYRRARRSRKARYRAPRFLNRTKPKGWLPPTIRQKKDSLVRVVKDLKRILNITSVVVEEGQFDTASLSAGHPLHGVEYQIPRYAGRDFRAKVLWRDGYRCQHCGRADHLQAHHIQPRSEGGSDTPNNGLTLCEACHKALHAGEWVLTTQPRMFIYPMHLQTGKYYLRGELEALGLAVESCVGWMTAYWREQIGLDKSHIHDAAAIACRDYAPRWWAAPYRILPKRKKVWEDNPSKKCEEKHGFRHWDLVEARHRTRKRVIGSVRSLKAKEMTLRTAWDDDFPVSYRKSRVVWRFDSIIYI